MWITASAKDRHGAFRPRITGRYRHLPGTLFRVLAVTQPVVDHELKPGGGGHGEGRRRNERVPGEDLVADGAGIWLPEVSAHLRLGLDQSHVPSKAHFDAPHRRLV